MAELLAGPRRSQQAALALYFGAASAAFAVGQTAPGVWAFLLPALLSVAWRPRSLPGWLHRAPMAASRVWLVGAFVLAFVHVLYPVVAEQTVRALVLVAGYGLAALSAGFVLGTRVWAPERGVIPSATGLLVLASFDPLASLVPFQVAAAAGALAYLGLLWAPVGPPVAVAAARRRRRIGLGVFAAGACGVALVIARFLPWAQPQVEQATATFLNPSLTMARVGFSESSSLGDIEQLALSNTVALRVWTPTPRKLRARVLTHFDGRTWRTGQRQWRELRPVADGMGGDGLESVPGTSFVDPTEDRTGGDLVRTRVASATPSADALFAPAGVVVARLRAPSLQVDAFGILQGPRPGPDAYGLLHYPRLDLVQAADPASPWPALCLDVPADTDPRLRALATRLDEGAADDSERMHRTLDYLGRECRYSLKVGRFESKQPVAEFLFDKKRGYCEYFASAAALLLRLQGVPVRYVTGFAMTGSNRTGNHYVVRESDAHAWIEAYLPSRGWVEADPTPAGDYEEVRASLRRSGLAALGDWLAAQWADAMVAVRSQGSPSWRWGAALAVAGVVLAVGRWWWRRRRGAAGLASSVAEADLVSVRPELRQLLSRADALWTRLGCPRPPHRAPLEHLRALPADRLRGEARAATERAVDCYYRGRFGGAPVTPEEIHTATDALQRSGGGA